MRLSRVWYDDSIRHLIDYIDLFFTAVFANEQTNWPKQGRHILAGFDDETIVVYQAYKPEIGRWAAKNGKFLGAPGFDPDRMTWIKTNFLWMMYRSDWARSKNQECILAIWLKREAFERYLSLAAHTVLYDEIHSSKADFQKQLADSNVRLQWDPDHHPSGAKQTRRAIQLGLKKVASFVNGDDIVQIQDITEDVKTQLAFVEAKNLAEMVTPRERVYTVSTPEISARIVLDKYDNETLS